MKTLKAVKENMEFTFTPVASSRERVEVEMYNTTYTLVRNDNGEWANAATNKFEMSQSLIRAILQTLNRH